MKTFAKHSLTLLTALLGTVMCIQAATPLPNDMYEVKANGSVQKYSFRVQGNTTYSDNNCYGDNNFLYAVMTNQNKNRTSLIKQFDLDGEHFSAGIQMKKTEAFGLKLESGSKKVVLRAMFTTQGRTLRLQNSDQWTQDQNVIAEETDNTGAAQLIYGLTPGQTYWVTGTGDGPYLAGIDVIVYDEMALYLGETELTISASTDTDLETLLSKSGSSGGRVNWVLIAKDGSDTSVKYHGLHASDFTYQVQSAYTDYLEVGEGGNFIIKNKFPSDGVKVDLTYPAGSVQIDGKYYYHPSFTQTVTIKMADNVKLVEIRETTSVINDGYVMYDGATNTTIPSFRAYGENNNDLTNSVNWSFTQGTASHYDSDGNYSVTVWNGGANIPSDFTDASFPVTVSCSPQDGSVFISKDVAYTLRCYRPLKLNWVIAPWAKCKVGSENIKMYESLLRTQTYKKDSTPFTGVSTDLGFAAYTVSDNNTLVYADGWATNTNGAMIAQDTHVANGGDYSVKIMIRATGETSGETDGVKNGSKVKLKLYTNTTGAGPTTDINLGEKNTWIDITSQFASVNSGSNKCAVALLKADAATSENPSAKEIPYTGGFEVKWVQVSQRRTGDVAGDYYISSARTGKFAYYIYNANALTSISYKIWYQGDQMPSSWQTNRYGDKKYGDELEVPVPDNFNTTSRKEGYLLVKIEKEGQKAWYGNFVFNFLQAPDISAEYDSDKTSAKINLTSHYSWNTSSKLFFTTDGSEPGSDLNTSREYTKDATYTTNNTMFYGAERYQTTTSYYTQPRKPDDTFDSSNTSNILYISSAECPVKFTDSRIFYVEGVSDADGWQFGYTPRSGNTNTDNKTNYTQNASGSYSIHTLKSKTLADQDFMKVMFGTTGVNMWYNNTFSPGGLKWLTTKSEQDSGFDEWIDVYTHVAKGKEDGGNGNANPYTEFYGGIGTSGTEDGGFFLQPVSGDFLRFEPEFDGVVTVWIRQNGSTQSSTRSTGDMPRRPVYVMDENGKIMRRTTNRPTVESYFCVNGVFATINSSRSVFRTDFEETWRVGLERWKNLNEANRNAYRLYENWYHFNIEEDWGNSDTSLTDDKINIDASKQVSRYDFVNNLIYRSDKLAQMEASFTKTVKVNGTDQTKAVNITPSFAKYGYEAPNYNYARYRIPVKAGKTYYIGGRATKNGFVGVKFEPLECNVNPDDYLKAGNNFRISENFDIRYPSGSGTGAPTGIEAQSSVTSGKFAGVRDNQRVYKTYGINTTENASTDLQGYQVIETKHIYEDPDATQGQSNDWMSSFSPLTWSNATGDSNSSTNGCYPSGQYSTKGNKEVGTTCHVILHRTFENGKWYPIVLPFSVSESRLRQLFGDNVKVLYLDPNLTSRKTVAKCAVNESANKLSFTRHYYQMLYANVPAFICPDITNTMYQVDFGFVTLEKTNLRADGTIGYDISAGYEVVGSYTPVNGGSNTTDMYYLSNSSDGNANLYHAGIGQGPRMKATRVWIRKKAGHTAPPLMSIGFNTFDGDYENDNSESGICDIIADDHTIEMYNDDRVYDLMGRCVATGSTDGLPKGVYIHKGRKVYVR